MYEYKVVPAPVRAVKVRGLKTTAERFAHLLTETMNALAAEGWEYQRAEALPCEERRGLTGTRTSTQTVMVFRRALAAPAPTQAYASPPLAAPEPPLRLGQAPDLPAAPDSRPDSRPDARPARAEPVFRPGALARGEGERRFPPLRAGEGGEPGEG